MSGKVEDIARAVVARMMRGRIGKAVVVRVWRLIARLRDARFNRRLEAAYARLATVHTLRDVVTDYDARGRVVSRTVTEREVPPDPRAVAFLLANRLPVKGRSRA